MRTHPLIVFLLISLTMASHAQQAYSPSAQSVAQLGAVPADVKKQLMSVLQGYFDVKNALVATDARSASEKAITLITNLKAVQATRLTGPQQKTYAQLNKDLMQGARRLAGTQDIARQRESFSDLSKSVYTLVRTFPVSEAPTYYDYCPMAFNNQGGYWLSEQKPIANPYFGSRMMRCGSVKETL